jgi:hypothetical protein
LHEDPYKFILVPQRILLELRNFSDKAAKSEHTFNVKKLFPENCAL